MIGRDQHYHVNLNIFNFHHQTIYSLDGTNNRGAVRKQISPYKEHKLTKKPPEHHWHFSVKSQRILYLWRYGSHWSNSRSPPLLLSLIKNPSPSVFLSLCSWLLSLFPWLQLYFHCINVTPQPTSEIRAPNFSHSSICDGQLQRKLNLCARMPRQVSAFPKLMESKSRLNQLGCRLSGGEYLPRVNCSSCLWAVSLPSCPFPNIYLKISSIELTLRQVSRMKLLLTWSDSSSWTRWLPYELDS